MMVLEMVQNTLSTLNKNASATSSTKVADVTQTKSKKIELSAGAILLFAFIVGWYLGSTCTNKLSVLPIKRQAIERGFAEWRVVDQQVGTTEFVWKQTSTAN